MSDKPFRVLLDLTDLHVENFKYVWINVSPRELRTISDFKTTLLHKINLESKDIKLFVRDGLLLDEETIIVLREDDTVKVQYQDHFQVFSDDNDNKESRRSSRKRDHSDTNISDAPSSKKRSRKSEEVSYSANESDSLEMGHMKKKKHKQSFDSTDKVEQSEISVKNDVSVKSKKKKDKRKSPSLCNEYQFVRTDIEKSDLNEHFDSSFFSFEADYTTPEHCEEDSSSLTKESSKISNFKQQNEKEMGVRESAKKSGNIEVAKEVDSTHEREMGARESVKGNGDIDIVKEVDSPKKKKRKRHRKRKQTESIVLDSDVPPNTSANTKFVSFSDNVERKHVIYSSESYERDSPVFDEAKCAQNSSKETFVVSESTSKRSCQSYNNYPKVSTPAQSSGFGSPSWQVSLMQSGNSGEKYSKKSCMKETKLEKKSCVIDDAAIPTENISLLSSQETLPPEVQYENLPTLNHMPEVGMNIAYKTLELDETYSPVITEYREGVVKSIDPETDEIYIELSKHLIQPGRTGKFENLKEDEVPMPEIKRTDVLKWCSIVSPKRFS